jgi:hypothetical protein
MRWRSRFELVDCRCKQCKLGAELVGVGIVAVVVVVVVVAMVVLVLTSFCILPVSGIYFYP